MTAPAVTPDADSKRVGAWQAAALLSTLASVEIWAGDIDDMARAELLTPAAVFKGLPMYAVADLHALAAREDFTDLLARHRLLTTKQAAEYLEIRIRDFEYVVAAGWVQPDATRFYQVSRRKQVPYPVYHPSQLDALAELPGVDWEQVRATPPGRRSPLREFAYIPPTRAQMLRWFCARLSHRYQTEVWPWWDPHAETWFIDWDANSDGLPTAEHIRDAVAQDKVIAQHARRIVVGSDVGAVVRWARDMLEPGVSVVLDTETTRLHGRVCDIAVIDTATGDTLLDTLVNPGEPIDPEAQAIHGITDEMVIGAPTLEQVWPHLLAAVGDRRILAYNSDYDQGVVVAHARACGLDPARFTGTDTWGCIMVNRAAQERTRHWTRLGGGHRALGDTRKAREVLMGMTAVK